MGRIRTVKPELFLDEVLGCLSGDHVMLFIGLLTVADREGRLPWRPARLKATLFPYREVDVAGLGADLDAADKVQLYSSDGEEYLWIPGFVRHQRPHPKEPESVLPAAPSREKKRRAVEEPSGFPSSPVGREGKGREGKGREGDPLAAGAAVPLDSPAPPPPPALKPPQRAQRARGATNGGGELVLEATDAGKPARAASEAEQFWAQWQDFRAERTGLVREAPTSAAALNTWFARAVAEVGVTRLVAAAERYIERPVDGYWRGRGWPFAGFMSENVWRRYVPPEVVHG